MTLRQLNNDLELVVIIFLLKKEILCTCFLTQTWSDFGQTFMINSIQIILT